MSTPIRKAVPDGVYSLEDWALVQNAIEPDTIGVAESLFALSNGFLGVRGSLDQGDPVWQPTTVINGFHETWPIPYAEPAFGYATTGQTIVRVPDATHTRVSIDGQMLEAQGPGVASFTRRLDMRSGSVETSSEHRLSDGEIVTLKSTRVVSLTDRHLMATLTELTGTEGRRVEVRSALVGGDGSNQAHPELDIDDPRRTRLVGWSPLRHTHLESRGLRLISTHVTERSRLALSCGIDHVVFGSEPDIEVDDEEFTVVMRVAAGPEPIKVAKFISYHSGVEDEQAELVELAARALDDAVEAGFDELLSRQSSELDGFWAEADIEIDGDEELQNAVRWALFQLHQSTRGIENLSVPAKGLTGDAYEGHYFWDSEIYFLPFLAFTNPAVARELLRFRVGMLPEARRRAGELALEGALFPWRTINGQAAGSYYPAGTAQYHINADVVYAIRQYAEATGDDDFLWQGGVEVAVETARLWEDLGFFADGAFHIHLVTGPDEYTALVNDNAYTNIMARFNLRFAAEVVARMKAEAPDAFGRLREAIALGPDEPSRWKEAADAMFIGHNDPLGVTPQDSSFLSKERWDFEGTSPDDYPLLLHFHPLVIYRHQVLKQPDVVMAMLLHPTEFSDDLQKANFDYYDALTTGDSSLSSAVQATVAARLGYEEEALHYLRQSALIDIADLQGNTRDGLHLASAGGVWMALIRGFAGMDITDRGLSLHPKMPSAWSLLRFRLRYRGSPLVVSITPTGVEIEAQDAPAELEVRGAPVSIEAGGRTVVPR